jgi:glucokinase
MTRYVTPTRRRTAKGSILPRSVASVVMPTQAARPAQLRVSNNRLLLRLLRMNSPCSKADLVRMSGLTAPTVSMVVANLIANGLVEELGEGTSSGGRPPSMLRFNAQYGYVAGVDIGGTRVRMMLADLNGKPVAEWNTHMEEQQKTPRGVVELVHVGLDHMVAQAGLPGRVLHLTAGAPGITDVKRGVVLAAPNLAGWNDVPLRMLLERELSISAEVENDTNLAAVGEHAEGVASGIDNFVFLAMGTGVGAGIYLRGALHQGATWSAGEVGYLPVTGAPRQRVLMRETGQLERIIGGPGIEARWKTLLRQDGALASDDLLELRASQIFDLAERGDKRADEILQSTARILADALSMIALMYNPELVVLGGGVGSHPALCSATIQYLQDNDFALPLLRSSSLGTRAQLFGAVSVSLAAAEQKLLC